MTLKVHTHFEIGNVYKDKAKKCFVAVTSEKAIGFQEGKKIERSTRHKLDVCRDDIPVALLCEEWGIELATLDKTTEEYRELPVTRTAPRAGKRRKNADEHFWKAVRTAKMLSH